MIDLKNKTYREEAEIKSDEIISLSNKGKYTIGDTEVEIVSLSKFQETGVQVYAKAWKNGEPIGFGADGKIEKERFIFINPPLWVEDENGDIIREFEDRDGNRIIQKFREAPFEALQVSLANTINKVGKDGSNIVSGSVGSSTLTVYASVDGCTFNFPSPAESWGTIRGGNGNGSDSTSNPYSISTLHVTAAGNVFDEMGVGVFMFDTSALTAGATISAATMSLRGTSTSNTFPTDFAMNVYGTTSVSDSVVSDGDFQLRLGTAFSDSTIAASAWNTAGYNDWVFNASGLAGISKTGLSKFCIRTTNDVNNTDPSDGVADTFDVRCNMSEAAGTTTDPTLVVTYTVALTGGSFLFNMV